MFWKVDRRTVCSSHQIVFFLFSEKTIEDFFVFKSCHDKICHDCLESVKGINVCPACEMPFNPEDDISDRSLIEDACERMEKFVWKVLALQ